MPNINYTPEDFKEMKKALKLNNKDVAEIIGTSEANVKIQTAPGRSIGTWARAMVHVYRLMKEE